MAYIAQPVNSQIRLSPYSQRLLQYGTDDSRIYLSKASNTLLNPYLFGYRDNYIPDSAEFPGFKYTYTDRINVIVDGLENDITFDGKMATVKIGAGQCICDTTLLIFPEETELDIDTTMLTYSTDRIRIILSVNFHWLETLYEQPPRLRLMLIDPNDPLNYGPDSWDTYIDKLVISVYDINLTTGHIINANPHPSIKYDTTWVNIKNIPYEIGPCISFLRNFVQFTDLNYTRKQVVWTKPCVVPESLIENKVTLPITYYSNNNDPIIGIQFDIRYDPILIKNPKFEMNQALTMYNKTVDFYVDMADDVTETGLIRIQIGENSIQPTLIPSMIIGNLTLSYTTNSPEGTRMSLLVENTVCTYSNATTATLPFFERTDPEIKMNKYAPILTFDFQASKINFGRVNLDETQFLIFEMNGVFQKLPVTAEMAVGIESNLYYNINRDLKAYWDVEHKLVIEALNGSTDFTNAELVNNTNTHKMLYFEKNDGSVIDDGRWDIKNEFYYWEPTPGDTIHFTFEDDEDSQAFTLDENDINVMLRNENNWTVIPSLNKHLFDVLYENINGKHQLHIRLCDEYVDAYVIKELKMKIGTGNGLTSNKPMLFDYHPAEQFYDLDEIHLNNGDVIKYKDSTINQDMQLILTDEIISVLKSRTYGYRSGNLYVNMTNDNKLRLSCNTYDSQFEYTHIEDYYTDNHEPTSAPCLWIQTGLVSTRPKNDDSTFVEDPNLVYSTSWELGDLPTTTAGERDFYTTVDLSYFHDKDVQIQCYCENFLIQPMAVEKVHYDPNLLKVWMPESFVLANTIKQLKLIIIG